MPKRTRNPGRKRPAGAELLLAQVKEEFSKKKAELSSAKKAADELNVGLASFYNYINGKTLPDMEVLRRASEKWEIKWKHIDMVKILSQVKVRTPQQLIFSFLDALREEDVQVVWVGPKSQKTLQVTLNIRFTA
jgi:hypothetical protein